MVTRAIGFIIRLPFIVADLIYKGLILLLPDEGRFATTRPIIHLIINILMFGYILSLLMTVDTMYYAIVLISAVLMTIITAVNNPTYIASAQGTQRWATYQDIKKANLLNQEPALILGDKYNSLVGPAQNKDWHTIMVGGAGTGKSTCSIIPTLLSFKGSAIVLDIKGELEATTRHFREAIGPVYVLNPTKTDTYSYNPIEACDSTPDGINECRELGNQLVPYPPGGARDNKWAYDGARGLVSAVAYIVAIEQGGTLRDVAYIITSLPHYQIAALIDSADDTARMMASSFMIPNEKMRGYYISQASDYLQSFALDYELVRVTTPAENREFTFSMLENPCTVYLQIPEQKLQQASDLFRLIFMQLLRHLQARGEGKQPHILVCMDEFPQLGRIAELPDMLATLRSRNTHIMLACQSLSQIDVKYNNKEIRNDILSNCNYISVFGASDKDGQEYFSFLTGHQTVKTQSGGRSDSAAKLAIGGSKGTNYNWQESGQPLIRPEELRDLRNNVLVINRDTFPMRLQKAYYFKPNFILKNRLKEGN